MSHIVIDARESGSGTGRYIDKLIQYLAPLKSNHHFTVLTTPSRVDFVKNLAPKFDVLPTKYKEFSFGEQLGFSQQIKKLKPDLVHFGMVQQPILYPGKVVTSMLDLTTARFRNPATNPLVFFIKQSVYKFVNRWAARKSSAIITISEYVKNDVARFAGINSRKITVTYCAADRIPDKPEPVSELVGKEFVLYVGRPLPHKNLSRLIDAFVLIQQSSPETGLVLVGKEDALYKKLQSYVSKQGINNVFFTGFVSEGQLRWLYEQAVVYAFPSLSEGFGLPALEAMLHDCPVASSNATCLPEVNGPGAVYFDPLDIANMAKVILSVIKNKSLASDLKTKGRRQASKYSWSRMAQQTLSIYDEVLKQS